MSEKNANAPASPNGKPAPAGAVIRLMEAAEESSQERLIKKHVPAWVVSGAIHVAVIALMILFLGARSASTKPPEKVVATTAEKTDEPEDPNLVNTDPGLDSNLEAALPEIERVEQANVEAAVTQDNVGKPDAAETDTTALNTPGLNPAADLSPGVAPSDTGSLMSGGSGEKGSLVATFPGRSGATKNRLVREGGGNSESERAVAMGLAWLARQQKSDGGWEFDVAQKAHPAAATGMALLPFLAAGETHKPGKEKREPNYHKTVQAGLGWLMQRCPHSGPNAGKISTNMYEQAIATIPLCEAYGMTKDETLRPYAQAAINFIQKAQGPNGSWGYGPNGNGDTSIVGWQVQALQAAKLSKLVVDDRVIKKAIAFLNLAAGGSRKSMYGYADSAGAAPGTALTAVGLLCRYYIDNWGPSHPGMIDGVAGLVKNPPIYKGDGNVPGPANMYYYYYATQVVHFYEGEDWKNWNEGVKQADGTRKGGMRDWLVKSQNKKDGANLGSWDPEGGFFGSSCGRVGTTAVCLLTLEVYYRHLPLYKRGADGNAVKILEDK